MNFHFNSGNKAIVRAINSAPFPNVFITNAKLQFPKMGVVNKYLTYDNVWHAFVNEVGLPSDTKLPRFGPNLLYGVISDEIHDPQLAKIIVSDKADAATKAFFHSLGKLLDKQYSEFDEELASSAEDHLD